MAQTNVQVFSGNVGIGKTDPLFNLDIGSNKSRISGVSNYVTSASSVGTSTYVYIGRFTTYGMASVSFTCTGNSSFSANYATFIRHYDQIPTVSYLLQGDIYTTHQFYYQIVDVYSYDVWHRQTNLPGLNVTYYVSGAAVSLSGEPAVTNRLQFPYGYIATQGASAGIITNSFNGNVGIGTTNPSQGDLTVYALGADPYFSGYVEGDYAAATDFTGLAHFKSSGSHGAIRISNTSDNTGSTRIDFNPKLSDYWGTNTPSASYFRGTAPAAGRIMVSGEVANNYEDAYMSFHTCRDMRVDGSGGTGNLFERMRITSTGDVGIGTATPGQALHLYRSGTSSRLKIEAPSTQESEVQLYHTGDSLAWSMYMPVSSDSLRFYRGGDKIAFTSGGNVGIGTNNPLQKLDLGDLGGGSIRLGQDHDGDNTSTNRIGRTGVGNSLWYASVNFMDEGTNDDAIAFVTHQTGIGALEKMRISGNGNVGIGTNTPGQKLDVNGDFRCGNFHSHRTGGLAKFATRQTAINNVTNMSEQIRINGLRQAGFVRAHYQAGLAGGNGALQHSAFIVVGFSVLGDGTIDYDVLSKVQHTTTNVSMASNASGYVTLYVNTGSSYGSYVSLYTEWFYAGGIYTTV
jgi:hypothetical protein